MHSFLKIFFKESETAASFAGAVAFAVAVAILVLLGRGG